MDNDDNDDKISLQDILEENISPDLDNNYDSPFDDESGDEEYYQMNEEYLEGVNSQSDEESES